MSFRSLKAERENRDRGDSLVGLFGGAQVALLLEVKDNLVDGLTDRDLGGIDDDVSVFGGLIGVINTGQTLQLTSPGLLVQALGVTSLAHLDGGGDVNKDEPTTGGLDGPLGVGTSLLVGGDGADNGDTTRLGDVGGDVSDTLDGGVPVLLGVTEVGGEVPPEVITVKGGDGTATVLEEGNRQSGSNGGLSGARETGEEDGETLLVARGVGSPEHLDHIGEGEPGRDINTLLETTTELSSRDGFDGTALRDLVDLEVLSTVLNVDHVVVGQDLDAELRLERANQVLGIIISVEVLAVSVLTGTSVVTTDDKVGSTVVLTDEGVPQSLTGTSHSHGKREETEGGHTRGVGLQQLEVDTDTGEVIDISRLGHTDNGVDEHVGLGVTSSTEGQLTVRAMHGVTGLESNNTNVAVLAEGSPDLTGGHAKVVEVVVDGEGDTFELTTEVDVSGLVEEVLNGRVTLVIGGTENHLGFAGLVGGVDGTNSQDSEGVSVTVPEGDTVSDLVLLGGLLGNIKGNGHGPDLAVDQPGVLNNGLVVVLVEETLEGGETSVEEHLDIAQLARSKSDGGKVLGLFLQLVKGGPSDKQLLGSSSGEVVALSSHVERTRKTNTTKEKKKKTRRNRTLDEFSYNFSIVLLTSP